MAVIDTVPHGEGDLVRVTERLKDTVTERVKGCVVGMPVVERVLVGDIV